MGELIYFSLSFALDVHVLRHQDNKGFYGRHCLVVSILVVRRISISCQRILLYRLPLFVMGLSRRE